MAQSPWPAMATQYTVVGPGAVWHTCPRRASPQFNPPPPPPQPPKPEMLVEGPVGAHGGGVVWEGMSPESEGGLDMERLRSCSLGTDIRARTMRGPKKAGWATEVMRCGSKCGPDCEGGMHGAPGGRPPPPPPGGAGGLEVKGHEWAPPALSQWVWAAVRRGWSSQYQTAPCAGYAREAVPLSLHTADCFLGCGIGSGVLTNTERTRVFKRGEGVREKGSIDRIMNQLL